MAKQVQPEEEIFVAPGITENMDSNGKLVITDDSTGKSLNPNKIDDKIIILEKQVNGWFLERATEILELENEDNGFVVLMIATTYIEGIEQLRRGRSSEKNSGEFFKNGLTRIFGEENFREDNLDNLHRELRCGLFHNGMTGPNIRIHSSFNEPIKFTDLNTIEINQTQFLNKVKEDFKKYLGDLRNRENNELRNNFDIMYKFTNT